MDTIDLSFSISYSVDFVEIPAGAEEYAEMIRANIESIVDSRIGDFIGDSFDSLNEDTIERMIDNIVQTELAVNASSAQSEKEQQWFSILSSGCHVTVSMSKSVEDITEEIIQYSASQLQTTLGGG